MNELLPCPVCGKTDCEAMQMYDFPKYPPEIQAVLTAAKNLAARVEYLESWYPEARTLFAVVSNLNEMEEKMAEKPTDKLYCADCGELYGENLDVTLPDDQWLMIHPDGESGILCGGCMVKRANKLPGIIAIRMRFDFGEKDE
jgi:hypothetical protein